MVNLGQMRAALTVTLVFLPSQVVGKRRPCLPENNEYYNRHLGCHKCDNCPVGTQPDYKKELPRHPKKGAIKCFPCRPCPPGMYIDRPNRQRCGPCRSCEILWRHTDQPCNAKQNAVCGRCLPGYHDIYKLRYNSSQPQYDKACMPCSDASKDVLECANTTLPTFPEKEGRTPHSTTLDREATIESENPKTQPTQYSAFHREVLTAIPYLMIALILVFVIATVILQRRSSTSARRRQQTANSEVELCSLCPAPKGGKSRLLKEQGNPNSSYNSNESVRLPSRKTVDNGPRAPLLPEVTTDGPGGEESCPSKNPVARKSNYRLIQKRIGKEWKDLARALVISDPDIEKLEMDFPEARERIYQLLLLWERTCESEALPRQLCSALQSIGRHDVAIQLLHADLISS